MAKEEAALGLALGEERVRGDLGGLPSRHARARTEVGPALPIARLARTAARVALHDPRPVEQQPLYVRPQGAA